MREKLNVKAAIILLSSLAVMGGSYFAAHAYQTTRNMDALLGSADLAEKQNRPDRAAKFLGLYLNGTPDDLENRIRYAQLLDRLAQTPRARQRLIPLFEQILVRDPQRPAIRRRLADLQIEARQIDDALITLRELCQDFPEDGEIEFLMARCFEARKDFPEAADWYIKSAEHSPKRIDTYLRLARVLTKNMSMADEAWGWLQKMVDANPNSFQVYLARARFGKDEMRGTDQVEQKAAEDIEKALSLAPDETSVLLAAADVARQDALDRGRNHLLHLIKVHPDEPRAYEALAGIELSAQRPKEAETWLRRGLKVVPGHGNLLWNLANLLIKQGATDEARKLLGELAKTNVAAARTAYLQAMLQVQEGNLREGADRLEAIRPYLTDAPELLVQADVQLGQCYRGLGDSHRALPVFRRVIAQDPLNVPARLSIVSIFLDQDRLEAALEECSNLMHLPRPPAAGWPMLARLRILQNYRLPPAQREWEQVNICLENANKITANSLEVTLLRAEALVAQGKNEEAHRLLRTACEHNPRVADYWLAIAELAERDGKLDAAKQALSAAKKNAGDTVEVRLAEARYRVNRADDEALQALAKLSEGMERFPEADQARLLNGLAIAYVQLHAADQARKTWGRLVELQPKELSIRLWLFDLAREANDEDEMVEALHAIRQIEGPEGALGDYNQARYLIWQARLLEKRGKDGAPQLHQARGLLNQAGEMRSGWPRVPLALAEIDKLEGSPEREIDDLVKAVTLGERQLPVMRRAVELLYERHRYAEADLIIQRLPIETPVFGNLQRLAAQVSLESHDAPRALTFARKAVSTDSRDPKDHRWLAEILSAATAPLPAPEAEKEFRKAIDLDGADADSWVALVGYLARTGQAAEAEATIGQAREKLAKQDAQLALAQCYATINRLDKAKALYQTALAERPDDLAVLRSCADFFLRIGQLSSAERCLKKIIRVQTKNPVAVRQAQNLLAVVLASGGDYKKSREALSILGLLQDGPEVRQNGVVSVEDQRAQAVVLATQPDRRQQQKAIRILEELDQHQPLSDEDRFLLVQLYDRTGDDRKAADSMQRLLAAKAREPRYVVYQIRSLLNRGLLNDAELWFATLEKAAPKSIQTLELRARLLKAQGKESEAAARLTSQMSVQEPGQMLELARLFEELDFAPSAEPLYRRYAEHSKDPQGSLLLARYLGRINKLDEALNLCSQAWLTCPPEAVGNASLAVLHSAAVKDDRSLAVKRLLQAAIQKNPNSNGLLVCLADLEDLSGQHAQAVRLYREILKRDPYHPEALNNLAWLIAYHKGSEEESLRLVNQAMEQLGPIPELLDTRAVAYLGLEQADRALEDLNDAASSKSVDKKTMASIKFHLARALLMENKRQEATKAFQAAQQAGLKFEELHPYERDGWQELVAKAN
ncbi:MAG: tetratricopeptide repeat protein [Gemmataceae bacterium]